MRSRSLLLTVFALAGLLTTPGCIAIMRQTQGVRIDPQAVGKLEPGLTTLPQILDLFGAPLEVHDHVDGHLLVYRHRARNTMRLELSPRGLSYTGLSQIVTDALENLSFTLERTHKGEDRLVLLLDKRGKLRSVAYRDVTADLPIF